MQRRALLGRLGLASAAALAGCLGGAPGGDPTTPSDTTGDPNDTTDGGTTTDPNRHQSDAFDRVEVGSREGVLDPENNRPHLVRVWNDADRKRTLGLHVAADGETRLDREIEFPARGYLDVSLLTPATYAVRVSVGGDAEQIPVPRSRFDCNGSVTAIHVGPDGGITSQTRSSGVACPTTVIDHAIDTVETGCGDGENSATLSVDGERATVTGTVAASTPCHVAVLQSAGYGDDEFVVTVGTADDDSDACVQCLGAVDYEATLTFDGAAPPIRVVHDALDGDVTVARTE